MKIRNVPLIYWKQEWRGGGGKSQRKLDIVDLIVRRLLPAKCFGGLMLWNV